MSSAPEGAQDADTVPDVTANCRRTCLEAVVTGAGFAQPQATDCAPTANDLLATRAAHAGISNASACPHETSRIGLVHTRVTDRDTWGHNHGI